MADTDTWRDGPVLLSVAGRYNGYPHAMFHPFLSYAGMAVRQITHALLKARVSLRPLNSYIHATGKLNIY